MRLAIYHSRRPFDHFAGHASLCYSGREHVTRRHFGSRICCPGTYDTSAKLYYNRANNSYGLWLSGGIPSCKFGDSSVNASHPLRVYRVLGLSNTGNNDKQHDNHKQQSQKTSFYMSIVLYLQVSKTFLSFLLVCGKSFGQK